MCRLIVNVICLVMSGRPLLEFDESVTSNNLGIFRELLNLLSKYDNLWSHF